MQLLDRVEEVEASWTGFCNTHRITVRSCPSKGEFSYESRYGDFVKKFYANRFPRWQNYDKAKSVFHILLEMGDDYWPAFKNKLGSAVSFSDPKMPSVHTLVSMMHSMAVTLTDEFRDSLDADLMQVVTFEFTKLCIDDAVGPAPVLRNASNTKALVRLMLCPMVDSVIFKQRKATAESESKTKGGAPSTSPANPAADEPDEEEPAELPTKFRRVSKGGNAKGPKGSNTPKDAKVKSKGKASRAKAKAKAQGPKKAQAHTKSAIIDCSQSMVIQSGRRQKLWLDDFADAVHEGAKGFNIKKHWDNPVSHQLTRGALFSLVVKSLDLVGNSKAMKKWSMVRPALCTQASKGYGGSFEGCGAGEVSAQLTLVKPSSTNIGLSELRLKHDMETFCNDFESFAGMKSFTESNPPEMPVTMMPVFTNLQHKLYAQMIKMKAKSSGKLDAIALLQMLSRELQQCFPPRYIEAAAAAHGLSANTLAHELDQIFDSLVTCEDFLQLRSNMVLEIVSAFSQSGFLHPQAFAGKSLIKDNTVWSKVVAIDSLASNALLGDPAAVWLESWKLVIETVEANWQTLGTKNLASDLDRILTTASKQILSQFAVQHPEKAKIAASTQSPPDASSGSVTGSATVPATKEPPSDGEDGEDIQQQDPSLEELVNACWQLNADHEAPPVEQLPAGFGDPQHLQPVDLMFTKAAMNEMQHTMMKHFLSGHPGRDKGYEFLAVEDGKAAKLSLKHGTKPDPGDIKLMFVRKVTTVPSARCFPTAIVGHHQLYIEGPPPTANNPMYHEFPIPAWLVEDSSDEAATTMEMFPEQLIATFKYGDRKWDSIKTQSVHNEYVVKFTVYNLQMKKSVLENIKGKVTHNIPLLREREDWDGYVQQQAAATRKELAELMKGNKTKKPGDDDWTKVARHLLT